MAFVALQIDNDQILVASAKVATKRMQVSHLFSIPIEGDDAQAGEKLKSELATHGLSRSDAIVVVSRADAEMRELSVPPAPNNELPDMVRFIARSEFATLNESWALDYFPMSDDEDKQRTVLAVGISPELQKQIQTIVEPAGLRVKHIVMRPYASLCLIQDEIKDDECRLLVDPNGNTTDMTLAEGGKILATRTVRILESHDANKRADLLLSEVRRTLASSRKTLGERKVSKIVVFGLANENKSLEGNLRNHLELETEFVNPLKHAQVASSLKEPASVERYAALLGALAQNSLGKRHPIDFVNPRRPVIKKHNFKKLYLYGGFAAAALLLGVLYCWWILRAQSVEKVALQNRIDAVQYKNDGRAKDTQSVDQIVEEVEKIDNWVKSDINWLEELYQFSERALTPDDAIVDLYDASASTRSGSPPKITVKTRLADIAKETQMKQSLKGRPFEVDPSRGGLDRNDEEYPLSSTFNVSLMRDDLAKMRTVNEWADKFLKDKIAKILGKGKQPETEQPESPE